MAPVPPRGPTRHRARLASPGVDGLLALAVPTANGWWAAPHRGGAASAHPEDDLGEPLWGQRRVQAELTRLGFTVSARTVATYKRRPYDGVPSPSWREFLTRQAKDIWACDFFSVRTIFFQTLDVFFVMRHETRQIVQVREPGIPRPSPAHSGAFWLTRRRPCLVAPEPRFSLQPGLSHGCDAASVG